MKSVAFFYIPVPIALEIYWALAFSNGNFYHYRLLTLRISGYMEIFALWKGRSSLTTASEKRRTASKRECRARVADWYWSEDAPRGARGCRWVDKPTAEKFPREIRIVRSLDYQKIYKSGRRVHSERFVLFGRENGIDHHRLGITVSRKIGCAPIRNRIKRLFREIFRRSSTEIPNRLDVVVNAKAGCVGASYTVLREDFLTAARMMCR
jgi:ribonuclease P protein component